MLRQATRVVARATRLPSSAHATCARVAGFVGQRHMSSQFPLQGGMQNTPLLISSLIDFAAENHPEAEIVSRKVEDNGIHRYTYAEASSRSKRVANALANLGVKQGDRIATLAWNGYRHFELYYGVSGMGAVLHTINPRLFAEQIIFIANHAEDSYLFVETTFLPAIEKLAPHLKTLKGVIVMTGRDRMPSHNIEGLEVLCYEELLAAASDTLTWPKLDESAASSLCYTSGTTGNPKGVLFHHRSTVLHSMAACMPDALNVSTRDTILPVVPMFHANAWGIVYAAPMCGAKLVFPGAAMDGQHVYELLRDEKVSMAAGVPTVWLMLLDYMRQNKVTLPDLDRTVIGGAAAPASMIDAFENHHDVRVLHAWGMTEMSPLGTVGQLKPKHVGMPWEERLAVQRKQGRAVYGVEMKIVDDQGKELPRDGVAFGNLLVRGPWICDSYFRHDVPATDEDSWFETGDVATIDQDGYMSITDRAKDVIKSGGEWISSIDLENIVVGHPDVMEAAVIGVPHPKWDERPMLVVVRKQGQEISKEDLLAWLQPQIAKWWMPDDCVFVDEIPHTATGKILKTKLRETFKDHVLPTI